MELCVSLTKKIALSIYIYYRRLKTFILPRILRTQKPFLPLNNKTMVTHVRLLSTQNTFTEAQAHMSWAETAGQNRSTS